MVMVGAMIENNETKQILNRLMTVFNVDTDSSLSAIIKIPARTISTWRTRNSTPYELCLSVAKEKNLNLNWLLTGEGEMYKTPPTNAVQEIPPSYQVTKPLGTLEEMMERLTKLERIVYHTNEHA